jgi:peptidoglycan/xylan/chitin deacetylase (PgdA/CDA1 family)
MKHATVKVTKGFGRPIKRVLKALIDTRLVDYHMPEAMPGDLLLTFDDGPHPEFTPRVLDLLDEFSARAVFFMIGARAEQRLDLVQACHARGHVVANHTYTHLNDHANGRYSRSQVAEDIIRCSDLLYQATGQRTKQFRPPRGELNLKTWAAAKDTGHRLVLWSASGEKWGRRQQQSAAEISAQLTREVRKRDILLLHDDNEKTIPVLHNLLKRLKAENYDLASAAGSLR